jgi:hypothetical protein
MRGPRWRPILFALWGTLCACPQPLPAELPGDDTVLYFPSALVAMPDGHTAFVASSNFDQRFDAGWLTRIDLDRLAEQVAARASLRPALARELKIPSLAGDLVTLPDARRAYVAHRGSGTLTALDFGDAGGSHLHCGTPGGAKALGGYLARTDCDQAHLFDLKKQLAERDGIFHSPRREQLNDPLALVRADDRQAMVAFLGDERIVGFDQDGSGLPRLSDAEVHGPGRARYGALTRLANGGLLACGHASAGAFATEEALLSVFPAATPSVGQHMFLSRELADGRSLDRAPGHLIRAVEAADGRVFVLTRGPEAILVLEPTAAASTRLDEEGALTGSATADPYALVEAYPVPGVRLTDAALVPHDGGELLVVTSLERDALYVFDVSSSTRLHLAARLRIAGRGPNRLLLVGGSEHPLLLVSTFYDHGLTVLDLSPANATDFVATSFADATNPSHLPRP